MAVKNKFTCKVLDSDFIEVESSIDNKEICINGVGAGKNIEWIFDIETAVKFVKTLRTEIAKIKEGGSNG